MARDNEQRQYKIYSIPDNFIDEGRINAGMISVRTRYLVEAIIIGLAFAIISFFIPVKEFNNRLTVTIVFAGPGFGVGLSGINGEPVSTTLAHIRNWYKQRQIMLYDNTPLVLTTSPVEVMMNENNKTSALTTYLEERKKKKEEERESRQYVLGENFEFAADRDNTREYISLEALIQREIDKQRAAEQAEKASLEEVVIEEDFDGPVIPEEEESDDDTLTIYGADPDDEDALSAISFGDQPLFSIDDDDDEDEDAIWNGKGDGEA